MPTKVGSFRHAAHASAPVPAHGTKPTVPDVPHQLSPIPGSPSAGRVYGAMHDTPESRKAEAAARLLMGLPAIDPEMMPTGLIPPANPKKSSRTGERWFSGVKRWTRRQFEETVKGVHELEDTAGELAQDIAQDTSIDFGAMMSDLKGNVMASMVRGVAPKDMPTDFSYVPLSELERSAEKFGYLWKDGVGITSSLQKRWCLLLPVPQDGAHTADGIDVPYYDLTIEPGTPDRWLVYYAEKEPAPTQPTPEQLAAAAEAGTSPNTNRTTPKGAIVLPRGQHSATALAKDDPDAQGKDFCFRLTITGGMSAGKSFVMAADTADGLFSWMQTLNGNGASATSRVPNSSERTVLHELFNALPPDGAAEPANSTRSVFDPSQTADGDADRALLQRCWVGFGAPASDFCLKGEGWKAFGFQRDDPVSDLRACGRFALQQLVYFLETYPTTARTMCKAQTQDEDFTKCYPWATAAVSVTRMLCMILDLIQPSGVKAHRPLELGCRGFWHLAQSVESVHEVFCILFESLDTEFRVTGGTYMTFPVVLASAREKLRQVLATTHVGESLAGLRIRAQLAFRQAPGATAIDDIFATDEFRPHLSLMHDVPHIFSLLTQRLGALLSSEAARAAAREAGLFMVAGEAASVAWLKEELNRGEEPARVLGHCNEPLVLATLLLAFLQELPEPLIPPEFVPGGEHCPPELYPFQSFGPAGVALGPSASMFDAYVSSLPKVHQAMVRLLIVLLQRIQLKGGDVVWRLGPTLIRRTGIKEMKHYATIDVQFVARLLHLLPPAAAAEHLGRARAVTEWAVHGSMHGSFMMREPSPEHQAALAGMEQHGAARRQAHEEMEGHHAAIAEMDEELDDTLQQINEQQQQQRSSSA